MGLYVDFNTPIPLAGASLFLVCKVGCGLAGFISAGRAIVAGSTDIIPIKMSPNQINPSATEVNIVKLPVTNSNIDATAHNAQADQ